MSSNAVSAVPSDDRRWTERSIGPAGSPSRAVLEAVASVRNESIERLTCLYDAVDPDALDTLFGEEDGRDVSVRFEYGGCLVHVTDDRVRATDAR